MSDTNCPGLQVFPMKYRTIATVVAALTGTNAGQAAAETFSSSYTSTAPKHCRMIGKPDKEDGGTTRVCPGRSGLVVLVSEGDLREVVSVGRNHEAAAREPAAQAWFGPFSSTMDTVEWRAAGNKPFAIIQRWLIADNDAQELRDPLAMLVARDALHLEPERDVVVDRHVGEQRVLLEDHVHGASVRQHVRDVVAVQQHAAGVGALEARDHAERRRLPAAAGAEQREELAVADLERDVVDGGVAAEALADALEDDGVAAVRGHARV